MSTEVPAHLTFIVGYWGVAVCSCGRPGPWRDLQRDDNWKVSEESQKISDGEGGYLIKPGAKHCDCNRRAEQPWNAKSISARKQQLWEFSNHGLFLIGTRHNRATFYESYHCRFIHFTACCSQFAIFHITLMENVTLTAGCHWMSSDGPQQKFTLHYHGLSSSPCLLGVLKTYILV